MVFYIGLLLLVTAVSLDGFGVGISYGIQKIKLPLISLCIIMFCSSIVVLLSMTVGNFLTQFLSENLASRMGGFILIFIGLFSLFNMLKRNSRNQIKNNELTLQDLINEPTQADQDKSGSISAKESIFLGIALALDAFGAGLGAAIIGYKPISTAILVGLMSGLFVFSGMKIGLFLTKRKKFKKISYVAPILLIALGVFNTL